VFAWSLLACEPGPVRYARAPIPVERARPTTVVQAFEEEERSHELRREAVEWRHPAPDGVDWREVERGNARAALARGRARRAAPPDPLAPRFLERGSDNQSGSSWELVATPTHYYSGTDLGGLWRAERGAGDLAVGWTPIGDELFGGVHYVVVLPAGAAGPEVSITSPQAGGLVHRSDDGGASWAAVSGLEGVWEVRGLAGRPTARIGCGWRRTSTTPGGCTCPTIGARRSPAWSRWAGARTCGCTATAAPRWRWARRRAGSGPTTARRSSGRRPRRGWTTPASRCRRRPSRPPAGWWAGTARGRPCSAPASATGWRCRSSTTSGGRWPPRCGTRRCSPTAGVDLHVSRDGGRTFDSPNTWDEYYADPVTKLHADLMAISVVPEADGDETWYAGTHGGPYRSRDRWRTARSLGQEGLRIGQYYSSHTDWTDPEAVLIGTQDQGLQSGRIADAGPTTGATFDQEFSGDFGHLVSLDEGSHRRVAMVYPGFVLVRAQEGAASVPLYYDYPPGESPYWLPVLVAEPRGKNAFYFLGRSVWRYEAPPDDVVFEAERWTETDFRLDGYEQLSGLVFDPLEPRLAWVVSTAGRLWRSEDGARTFEPVVEGLPFGSYYYGTALVATRHREPGKGPTLVVGGSGYAGAPVWRSRPNGKLEAWSEGLPLTMVNALVELRDGTGRIVAGTDTGVWGPRTGRRRVGRRVERPGAHRAVVLGRGAAGREHRAVHDVRARPVGRALRGAGDGLLLVPRRRRRRLVLRRRLRRRGPHHGPRGRGRRLRRGGPRLRGPRGLLDPATADPERRAAAAPPGGRRAAGCSRSRPSGRGRRAAARSGTTPSRPRARSTPPAGRRRSRRRTAPRPRHRAARRSACRSRWGRGRGGSTRTRRRRPAASRRGGRGCGRRPRRPARRRTPRGSTRRR
jgi:hypothetical protein